MKYGLIWESPAGRLGITEEDGFLTGVLYTGASELPGCVMSRTPLLERARQQLEEYFGGQRKVFDLPLSPGGTAFQLAVWQALQRIPYGETRTYGQVAEMIGKPRSCRAVGGANHRNPISIVVPCHRVIGKDGGLTGYAGGLDAKRLLLEIERRG